MARDKYLMYLRQQEYKKRIKLKVVNTRARMNREYMNQPEVDKETLELWNNQPAIHFDLGERKVTKGGFCFFSRAYQEKWRFRL